MSICLVGVEFLKLKIYTNKEGTLRKRILQARNFICEVVVLQRPFSWNLKLSDLERKGLSHIYRNTSTRKAWTGIHWVWTKNFEVIFLKLKSFFFPWNVLINSNSVPASVQVLVFVFVSLCFDKVIKHSCGEQKMALFSLVIFSTCVFNSLLRFRAHTVDKFIVCVWLMTTFPLIKRPGHIPWNVIRNTRHQLSLETQ